MRFSKFCATLLSTVLLTGQSVAQSSFQNATPIDSAPAAADENIGTPAMWRVADADSEFFLLGTFHILPPELKWRTPAFEEAFKKAETVYFEVDAETPDAQQTTIRIMMTEGFNPKGVTLSSMLDEADAVKFREIVTSLNLPLAGVEPMRPWQAFLTLTVQFIVNQGFDPGSGVDSVLIGEAKTLGKELRFFESLEQQLMFFTGFPIETELKLLTMTIRDWDEQSEAFDRLYNAWRNGDTAFIDEEMNDQMRDQAPEVYKTLIVDRNKAWAEEIAQVMNAESGVAMVAVGAGHLVGGESSVPALLAAMGFEVSRYGLETAANDNSPQEAGDDIGDLLQAVGEE